MRYGSWAISPAQGPPLAGRSCWGTRPPRDEARLGRRGWASTEFCLTEVDASTVDLCCRVLASADLEPERLPFRQDGHGPWVERLDALPRVGVHFVTSISVREPVVRPVGRTASHRFSDRLLTHPGGVAMARIKAGLFRVGAGETRRKELSGVMLAGERLEERSLLSATRYPPLLTAYSVRRRSMPAT